MKKRMLKKITITAMIAALYAALTAASAPFAFQAVQFRLSEALTLLPFLYPFSIVGVALGCLVSNFLSPFAAWDIIIGTSATLLACFLTLKCKNVFLAALPPVLVNGVFISALITFLIPDCEGTMLAFWVNFATVAAGQAVVCYGLGIPLVRIFQKSQPLQRLMK